MCRSENARTSTLIKVNVDGDAQAANSLRSKVAVLRWRQGLCYLSSFRKGTPRPEDLRGTAGRFIAAAILQDSPRYVR